MGGLLDDVLFRQHEYYSNLTVRLVTELERIPDSVFVRENGELKITMKKKKMLLCTCVNYFSRREF